MPSVQFQSFLAMARNKPLNTDAGLELHREGLERVVDLFPPLPDVVATPVDAGGIPSEWIDAQGTRDDRILFFAHGGGYSLGSLRTHRRLASDLARAGGLRALSIAYRLAPEHRFPAAVEDCVAAYRWLLGTGIKPEKIVFAGDSAGGGLVLSTMLKLRDEGNPLPAAGVCISPWTDLAATGASVFGRASQDPILNPRDLHTFALRYLGDADPRTPLASPLYGDMRGLPPLLIHVGSAEILLDDSTRLASRARDAGVDVTLHVAEEMIHAWHYFAGLIPEGEQAIAEVGQFIRAH
ncbi:MAG: alpha/beta hydrolase [Candidatus Hydrogenedentes bacterium]|nr:alpha/beta hydrolase [Candidatus Hydrogenedentota bacterium]